MKRRSAHVIFMKSSFICGPSIGPVYVVRSHHSRISRPSSVQIACLRHADGPMPGPDTPWSHEAAAAAGLSWGTETTADWGPQQTAAAPAEPARSLTVVLDTNVLIHGVGFVLDLRDSFIEGGLSDRDVCGGGRDVWIGGWHRSR